MKMFAVDKTTFALLLGSALLMGCSFGSSIKGEGEVHDRTVILDSFHAIVVDGAMDVQLVQGDVQEVKITAQTNIADLIQTKVTNAVWTISTKESYSTSEPVKITITLPTVDKVHVEGSGKVSSKSSFVTENMQIAVMGSGDVNMAIAAKKVDISVAGSGNVAVNGACSDLSVNVAGSGNVDAKGLQCNTAKVDVAGSGDAFVNVTSELNVSVAGSGDVRYLGEPAVKKAIAGSGELIHEN